MDKTRTFQPTDHKLDKKVDHDLKNIDVIRSKVKVTMPLK